ncbi:hypothetical protein BD408DRAFT_145118 [Parasitella parasitica]|nr:hypothetical protein BD408DRAFT_145118 [Parasitella parasitica]
MLDQITCATKKNGKGTIINDRVMYCDRLQRRLLYAYQIIMLPSINYIFASYITQQCLFLLFNINRKKGVYYGHYYYRLSIIALSSYVLFQHLLGERSNLD